MRMASNSPQPTRLTEAMDEEQLCEGSVEQLRDAFGCPVVQIISVVGDRIVLRAERAPEATPVGWTQSAQAGLIGRALIEDAPVLSEDVSREPSYRATLQSRGIRSELIAPIRTAKGTWGVINLEDTEVAAFDRQFRRYTDTNPGRFAVWDAARQVRSP